MKRFIVVAAVAALVVPAATVHAQGKPPSLPTPRDTLMRYAADTWHSFVMMTNAQTGLPSDNVSAEGVRAKYTSPTNIAAYIWAAIVARDVGVISADEARARIAVTLNTLGTLERSHGQFYNWYDPDTGARLTVWPVDGSKVYGFLSTVDNGWLASALMMVERAVPELAAQAAALAGPMDFGLYYDERVGQLFGGAWTEPPPGCGFQEAQYPGLWFTCFNYGTLNTEPRIASYIGIARGQLPPSHYYRLWRTFPPNCDWGWQEMQPQGVTRTYEGVDVFEGHYTYRGMNIVPSWGGSMFEALMVPLLVPEEQWAPQSWGVNHPLYVQAQIQHGMEEAGYGFWGFSPSDDPAGGYREYGVDPIGMNPDGYTSDEERTTTDYGFDGCRPPQPQKPFGQGVVTPHASFLALDFAQGAALTNLRKLRDAFPGAYGPGGFYDAVNVVSGQIARYHLALDQGMIMLAIGNYLTRDRVQDYFADQIQAAIAPLIGQEEFTAGG
jgi:hypothetical protein